KAALALLAEVAVLALEGHPRPAASDALPPRVRAPLPVHAARMLRRLVDARRQPYGRVEEFRADRGATQASPVKVSRFRRFVHLPAQAALIFAAAVVLFILASLFRWSDVLRDVSFVATMSVIVVFWPALARGGPSFVLCSLALARSDGRRAAWWQ